MLLQERHKREIAEQDFEKAGKAAAAEQARRDKEQARCREQVEVQQRLAAHKQGVKAARTRVDRAALQTLGEAFAARLQVRFPVVSNYSDGWCALTSHVEQPQQAALPCPTQLSSGRSSSSAARVPVVADQRRQISAIVA